MRFFDSLQENCTPIDSWFHKFCCVGWKFQTPPCLVLPTIHNVYNMKTSSCLYNTASLLHMLLQSVAFSNLFVVCCSWTKYTQIEHVMLSHKGMYIVLILFQPLKAVHFCPMWMPYKNGFAILYLSKSLVPCGKGVCCLW